MKKVSLLLLMCILVGCSSVTQNNFLTRYAWHCKELHCSIKFAPDGDYCGADFLGASFDEFTYEAAQRRIYLYEDGIPMHSYDIIYADNAYLVINAFGIVRTLENRNAAHNEPNSEAKRYIDTNTIVQPYVTILSCKDDLVTIAPCDYDADAADNYDVWQVPLSASFTAQCVYVTQDGAEVKVSAEKLSSDDYTLWGEAYTSAYVRFNTSGAIDALTFYGEQHIE